MKLRTIVIDDEPLAAMLLEGYIAQSPFLEHVATFNTAVAAIGSSSLSSADLILLDIQMPMLSGLEFSRMVNPRTRIIFTTAFGQYALDSYRVNALDYLLKPISQADFLAATQKALEWFKIKELSQRSELEESSGAVSEAQDSIYVKSDYRLLRIELSDILYVEGLKDYVKFYIKDTEHPILSLMNMKRAEQMLPPAQFIRVHRSYIVRKDKIKIIERSRIVFGKEYIPIGESYKAQFQEWLKNNQ